MHSSLVALFAAMYRQLAPIASLARASAPASSSSRATRARPKHTACHSGVVPSIVRTAVFPSTSGRAIATNGARAAASSFEYSASHRSIPAAGTSGAPHIAQRGLLSSLVGSFAKVHAGHALSASRGR